MNRQRRVNLQENMSWPKMRNAKLECTDDLILAEGGTLIMARWEAPMMKYHAEVVCRRGGDILEIGFGLGISAQYIQEQNINSHTIIEPHPELAENARIWSESKSNITIVEADWYDVVDTLKTYDGVFYDAEFDKHMFEFYSIIKQKIKPNGIFTFFNPDGDGTKNTHLIEGDVTYEEMSIEPPPYNTNENQYMKSDVDKYFIPIVINLSNL